MVQLPICTDIKPYHLAGGWTPIVIFMILFQSVPNSLFFWGSVVETKNDEQTRQYICSRLDDESVILYTAEHFQW
jgi:hypothetical protein